MDSKTKRRPLLVMAAICLGLMVAVISQVQAKKPFHPQYSDSVLAGKWWQWSLATGATAQTGEDPYLVDCALGQQGSVWFLGGSFGSVEERICMESLPRGKRLFFPLINVEVNESADSDECDFAGVPGCTVEERRELADGALTEQGNGAIPEEAFGTRVYACQLGATVDGVPVQYDGVPIVRVQSPPFMYEGDPETIADGYWVLLPPLPKGEHTISFAGAICDIAGPPTDPPFFKPEVTYTLRIK